MPTIMSWQLDDITTTGPDPFPASSTFNGDAIGVSTFTIGAGSSSIDLSITDNDTTFENTDASQDFAVDTTFNGVTWAAGDDIVIDYSYIVRPAGSTDPADEIQIYVLKAGGNSGDHIGIVSDARLVPGVTYEIHAQPEFADKPSAEYSSLAVCLLAGTRIATPEGLRRIEELRPGDPVSTRDGGPVAVLEVIRQRLRFGPGVEGAHLKPFEIRAGAFGPGRPERALRLSPQHRVLLRDGTGEEGLVPVCRLAGQPGVRRMRGRRRADYVNLLLPAHHLIRAEGLPVESFYPGAQAMSVLNAMLRLRICARFPGVSAAPLRAYGPMARPLLAAPLAVGGRAIAPA